MGKRVVFLISVIFFFGGEALQAQNPKWKKWEADADTLLNKQDFAGAQKIYSKIIKASKLKDQSVYGAVYKRAICFYSVGKFQEALKDLDIFLPVYPNSAQAHILRAFIYRELDDTDRQLIDLEEAISKRPGDTDLLKWMATLYLDKGDYSLAKDVLVDVEKAKPDMEVETYLGVAYYNLGKADSALFSLNKSIELDATYLPAYFYATSFCLQEEEYNLALKYINVPLRLDPNNSTALFYKGVALIESGKIDQGCSCMNKAFYAGYDDAADYLKEYCYKVED